MKLIAATAAILLSSASAYAADAIVYSEPAPVEIAQISNWAGGFIYGLAGYEWAKTTNIHGQADVINNFNGTGNHDDHKGNSGIFGAAAGYNWEFNNGIVLGAEAGIRSGTKLDDDGANLIYGNNFTQNTSLKYLGTVKARLGYDAGQWMPYVTGGLAFGKVKAELAFDQSPTVRRTWEDEKTATGFVVGAGVDFKVTENIFAGLEYNYTDLGKVNLSASDNLGDNARLSSKYKSNAVFAKVGYKF